MFSGAGAIGESEAPGCCSIAAATARSRSFLVHPGGPFWAEEGRSAAWTIAKGEPRARRERCSMPAIREFTEETGHPPLAERVPVRSPRDPPGRRQDRPRLGGRRRDLDAATLIPSNEFAVGMAAALRPRRAFPRSRLAVASGSRSTACAATSINRGRAPELTSVVIRLLTNPAMPMRARSIAS